MKRNKIAFAATSGLVGLSILAGSLAYASTGSDAKAAEELQQFLTANPHVAAVVANVEAKTGGKVTEAEFDDETKANTTVEFEVISADGSQKRVLYTLADGSMTVGSEDHDDDSSDGESENDYDGDDDSNKTDGDK